MAYGSKKYTVEQAFHALTAAYESEMTDESEVFFRLTLNAATAYNHTDLVVKMLSDERHDSNCLLSVLLPLQVGSKMCSYLSDLQAFASLFDISKALSRCPLFTKLTNNVEAKLEASVILHHFYNAYPSKQCHDNDYHFHHLMCVAKKHQHSELLSEMLSITRKRKYFGHVELLVIPSPISVAIENNRLALVALFLSRGASLMLTLRCAYKVKYMRALCMEGLEDESDDRQKGSDWLHVSSAVEQACFLDRPEILNLLLVVCDSDRSPERGMALHFACKYEAHNCIKFLLTTVEGRAALNEYSDECDHFGFNVSEVIRILKRNNSFTLRMVNGVAPSEVNHGLLQYAMEGLFECLKHMVTEKSLEESLAIIEELIDAGACLDKLDGNGLNPFHRFLEKVAKFASFSCSAQRCMTKADCRTVIRIVNKFIRAGSRIINPNGHTPLDVLLPISLHVNRQKIQKLMHCIRKVEESLSLIVDLVDLFLKLEAEERVIRPKFHHVLVVFKIAEELMAVIDACDAAVHYNKTEVDRCYYVMKLLMKLISRFLMSGDIVIPMNAPSHLKIVGGLLTSFVSYSEMSIGKGLQELVLLALNAEQLIQIKAILSMELDTMDVRAVRYAPTKNALEFLNSVEIPFCLQELTRRAIHRAIAPKVLLGPVSLGLAERLHKFVLLEDE